MIHRVDRNWMAASFNKCYGREKATSNKTPTLMKSMNVGIWVVGTTNQFFIRGS